MKQISHFAVRLGLLLLATLTAQAAQAASAKVVSLTGSAIKYAAEGGESPLQQGEILNEGDQFTTYVASEVKLVFSNGSELVVEENSSLTIRELSQEPFSGGKTYEQLSADPSVSQTLLELNYGKVDGHVKKLKEGSTFDIETPLGTAAIRGTEYTASLIRIPQSARTIFKVKNKGGTVFLRSRWVGSFEFNSGGVGMKFFDGTVSEEESVEVPPTFTAVIVHTGDRLGEHPTIDEIFSPEDPGVIVVSPSGPETLQ